MTYQLFFHNFLTNFGVSKNVETYFFQNHLGTFGIYLGRAARANEGV